MLTTAAERRVLESLAVEARGVPLRRLADVGAANPFRVPRNCSGSWLDSRQPSPTGCWGFHIVGLDVADATTLAGVVAWFRDRGQGRAMRRVEERAAEAPRE